MSPHGAVAELVTEEEARVRRELAALALVREELLGLVPAYVEANRARAADETIDIVEGDRAVSRLLSQHADRAAVEACIASPGVDCIETRWVHDTDAGEAIHSRVVLEHASRGDQRIQQPRASVRTVPRVPTRLVVFDRSAAFLPMPADTDQRMAVIRHPAVVESLSAAFELLWCSARPCTADHPEDGLRDHVRWEILQHLAEGQKDEVVARRLGLSLRTCRRHIAAIMEHLGATSRFQAGVLAQRSILERSDY